MASHASSLATPTWRPAFAVARWVALRGLRHPALAVLGLALVALVPLQARLSPLGDLDLDPAWTLAAAWVAPVGLLGAALALGSLGGGGAFLELLPPRARWVGEGLAVATAVVGLQLLLVLGAVTVARDGPGPGPWAWLLTDLQLVAVGVLLLRWRVTPSLHVGVFVGILWVLPAMLPPGGALAYGLRLVTDVARTPSGPGELLARGLTLGGILLASALLVSRRASASTWVAPR